MANEWIQRLQEARNVGEWLDARLHLAFTEVADGMFGDGRLTRDERIALSAAIGAALDVFHTSVEGGAKQLYGRDPYAPLEAQPMTVSEAASDIGGEFVELCERAVRPDGTIPVKIIQPGWGSTGYYGAEVLERDGPKIFARGTKMYWNHPTATEEAERPEGDLNALAAELVTAARWQANGSKGPGLYADAKVFEGYQAPINDLAQHIGVSIRGDGVAVLGEAEGKQGRIITRMVRADSIDFVTKPGAGGEIISMFEAARKTPPSTTGGKHSEGEEEMADEKVLLQLEEAGKRLSALEQENGRLREALVLREAETFARQRLATVALPDVTKGRLVESLRSNPPVKDGALDRDAFTARIDEAAKAEATYLASVGAGQVTGFGGQPAAPDPDALAKQLKEGFLALGLTENAAKVAAGGRL